MRELVFQEQFKKTIIQEYAKNTDKCAMEFERAFLQ